MFQFPRFPPARKQVSGITQRGCPIRTSPDYRLPAPPRCISSRGHVLHRPVAPRHPPCALMWIIVLYCSPLGVRGARDDICHLAFWLLSVESPLLLSMCITNHGPSWSCGDSNPGPPPCKGGALPTKLQPPARSHAFAHFSVGAPGLEPGTSALSGLRSNQLSYAPVGFMVDFTSTRASCCQDPMPKTEQRTRLPSCPSTHSTIEFSTKIRRPCRAAHSLSRWPAPRLGPLIFASSFST
jgi:hypothetical protein